MSLELLLIIGVILMILISKVRFLSIAYSLLVLPRLIAALRAILLLDKTTTFRKLQYGESLQSFILFNLAKFFILLLLVVLLPIFKDFKSSGLGRLEFIDGLVLPSLIFLFSHIVFVRIRLYPIWKSIQTYKNDLKEISEILEELPEDLSKKKELLKKLVAHEHIVFSEELVTTNMLIFEKLQAITLPENHYVLNAIIDTYETLLKKYNVNFGYDFLSPEVILLSDRYSKKLNKMVKHGLDLLD